MNIVYKPGKELFIADTLSRAFLPNKPSTEELKSEVLSVKQEEYLIKSIEEISMVEFLPITSERLVDLRRKTELDEGLQQLKHITKIGWPETKEEVPSEIRRYFDFKEELSIQDGILFKGNRVIVPVALRPHMITQVHSSHLGIGSCLNKARDVLFWPGITAEIKTNRQTSRKNHSYLMIHLNALGLMLQQTFSVLTTKSGSSSLTTGQITFN